MVHGCNPNQIICKSVRGIGDFELFKKTVCVCVSVYKSLEHWYMNIGKKCEVEKSTNVSFLHRIEMINFVFGSIK